MFISTDLSQVRLAMIFHVWAPSFKKGMDTEACLIKPKQKSKGLKVMKDEERLEKLMFIS